MGFDDIGCDPQYRESQLNQPIPEDDNVCWEIERFGFTESGKLNFIRLFIKIWILSLNQ